MTQEEKGIVLVADDNEIVREMVSTTLKKLGFTKIIEEDTGQSAWNEVLKMDNLGVVFKLIVSDVDMPEMNGIILLNKVRALPRFQTVPFMLLTAHAEKEVVLNAVTAGVTNYITKPFSLAALEKKIRATLHPEKKAA